MGGNWPGFTSEVIWESQAPGWDSGSFTSGEDQPTHTRSGRSRTSVYNTQALSPDIYRGKLRKLAPVLGILKGLLCLGGRPRPACGRHWELPALPPSSDWRTELLVGRPGEGSRLVFVRRCGTALLGTRQGTQPWRGRRGSSRSLGPGAGRGAEMHFVEHHVAESWPLPLNERVGTVSCFYSRRPCCFHGDVGMCVCAHVHVREHEDGHTRMCKGAP